MKKRDYLYITILISIFLSIVVIITRNKFLYGSTTDWLSQHVTVAEYIRNLFYDNHQLIPNFAFNISGGVNVFNMSYYGLLNPIILISYLLPNVSMVDYIQVSSILIIIVSIILFYIFSKRHLDSNLSFLSTLIFLCASPIIFHSHRHIMFVNYMPFMIMALIGVERYFNKNKSDLLITSIFFIIMISYFYSVDCILAITVYAIYYYLKNNDFDLKKFINTGLKYALRVIIAICIAGVLLLPTLYVVLNGRPDTNTDVSFISALIPTVNTKLVLYGSYSMGFTSIFIVAIIFNLLSKKKEKIFLSLVFTSFIIFPIINYILNAGMYINGKVLIPFVPLGAFFTGEALNEIFKIKFNKKQLVILILTASMIISMFVHSRIFLLDVSAIIFGIMFINKKYIFTSVLILISIVKVIQCNLSDELVKKDVLNKDRYDIYESIPYDNYRTESLDDYNSINKVVNINEYKITGYLSTLNKYYWKFYYETFENEDLYRNLLMIGKNQNILFNMYMGTKYIVGNGNNMIGYERVKDNLYKNDYVLPIGYASDNLMGLSDFNKLTYPDNIEALLKNIVVDDVKIRKNIENKFSSDFIKEDLDYEILDIKGLKIKNKDNKYFIKSNNGTVKLKYDKKYENQIVVIKFEVEDQECDENDPNITINGIKNILTCSNYRYYNNNKIFTYVLSDNNLSIKFSTANFVIKNIENYVIDFNNIKDINKNVDVFNIDKNKTKGDIIEGDIDVTNDGYLMFTIPYDEGFKIYVDDNVTNYELVDTAFIGFPISEGKHHIKLVYKSPYLKEGKIASIIGLISFIMLLYYERCKK